MSLPSTSEWCSDLAWQSVMGRRQPVGDLGVVRGTLQQCREKCCAMPECTRFVRPSPSHLSHLARKERNEELYHVAECALSSTEDYPDRVYLDSARSVTWIKPELVQLAQWQHDPNLYHPLSDRDTSKLPVAAQLTLYHRNTLPRIPDDADDVKLKTLARDSFQSVVTAIVGRSEDTHNVTSIEPFRPPGELALQFVLQAPWKDTLDSIDVGLSAPDSQIKEAFSHVLSFTEEYFLCAVGPWQELAVLDTSLCTCGVTRPVIYDTHRYANGTRAPSPGLEGLLEVRACPELRKEVDCPPDTQMQHCLTTPPPQVILEAQEESVFEPSSGSWFVWLVGIAFFGICGLVVFRWLEKKYAWIGEARLTLRMRRCIRRNVFGASNRVRRIGDQQQQQARGFVEVCVCYRGFQLLMAGLPRTSNSSESESPPPLVQLRGTFKIGGMTCSACSGTVQRALDKCGSPPVERAEVHLVTEVAEVVFSPGVTRDEAAETVVECVEIVGFDCSVVDISVVPSASEGTCIPAALYVQDAPCWSKAAELQGVFGVSQVSESFTKFEYDTGVIGARDILCVAGGECLPAKLVSSVEASSPSSATEMTTPYRSVFLLSFPLTLTVVVLMHLPEDIPWLSYQPFNMGVDVRVFLLLALVTPVQFVIGRPYHVHAWKALKARSPNMDVLISVATSVAYFYTLFVVMFAITLSFTREAENMIYAAAAGHYFGMCPILMSVVALGKCLEDLAKKSTLAELRKLQDSRPVEADLVSAESTGVTTLPVDLLHVGDTIRVAPGGQIPADGKVKRRRSASYDTSNTGAALEGVVIYVDESLLTGEATAVPKVEGDHVSAGSVVLPSNQRSLYLQVDAVGAATLMGQIETQVAKAHSSKAYAQRLADKVARVFVPSVILFAMVTTLVWVVRVVTSSEMHGGWHHPLHAAGGPGRLLFALKFGMATLMIACPCAMGLATPTAVTVSLGVAARKLGLLVKEARFLEVGASIDTIVLDKTGTITEGSPRVHAVYVVASVIEKFLSTAAGATGAALPSAVSLSPSSVPATVASCFWHAVGSAEVSCGASHPLAEALIEAARRSTCLPLTSAGEDVCSAVGGGVSCVLPGVGRVKVGNLPFVQGGSNVMLPDELRTWVETETLQSFATGIVYVSIDGSVCGALLVRDAIRPDAAAAISWLQHQRCLSVYLCTGDARPTALAIAQEVGIPVERVEAGCLPGAKEQLVKALAEDGRSVMMVGDGVNDAQAMAAAALGLAIHSGDARRAITTRACDILCLTFRCKFVLWASLVGFLTLCKTTRRRIVLNFCWAFIFNVLGLPVAAGVFYPTFQIPPLAAGIAMSASSLLVVTGSLLLTRFSPPTCPVADTTFEKRSFAKKFRSTNKQYLRLDNFSPENSESAVETA